MQAILFSNLAIIKKLQVKKIKVVVCTPTVIDEKKNNANPQDANNTEDKESGILTTDRVHLNEKGNALVADEMMKVLFNQ